MSIVYSARLDAKRQNGDRCQIWSPFLRYETNITIIKLSDIIFVYVFTLPTLFMGLRCEGPLPFISGFEVFSIVSRTVVLNVLLAKTRLSSRECGWLN